MELAEPGRLAPGDVVAERYRVAGLLGEGGMGVVYRVDHIHMRKTFALKVLHAEMCRLPEVLARFEREAIAAGNIEHPNVAAATDFGRLADGSFFLVLEYVAGRTLRAELEKGPMPPKRAIAIMRGIAAAVAAAHAKGIVHRDLKPENVMLVERDGDADFPKVLDFGIAKLEPDAPASAAGEPVLTRAGTLIGTPDYMSPEQAFGQPVDARTDLYSLGVIFHEMLAGTPPFQGEAVEVIQQHLLKAPPALDATIHPSIGALVSKLMAKVASDRVQTADALLVALDALAGDPATVAKKRGRTLLLVVPLLAGIGGIAFVALRSGKTEPISPLSSAVVEPATADSEPLTMPAIAAWEPASPDPAKPAATTTATAVAKAKTTTTTTKATPSSPPSKKKRYWSWGW